MSVRTIDSDEDLRKENRVRRHRISCCLHDDKVKVAWSSRRSERCIESERDTHQVVRGLRGTRVLEVS